MQMLNATSPEAKSADLVADNIEQFKTLFPELITDGPNGVAVNVDVLKALVGDRTATDTDEKYGLNWNGKRRARQLALTPSTGTLRPCPDESVDWGNTKNLMIEGDNLEVLKLLQKSYAGKVKVIYIDPPYNTGKDFVYPDNFQDNIKNYLELTGQVEGGQKITTNSESSGRYHTEWLNMMYPRLKLARNLLKSDGFIFVSIDDAEVHNLRHLLGEVFGEENFVANVIWQKKYTRANDATFFSDTHDHILVFAKSKQDAELSLQPRNDEQKAAYSNPDNHPKGLWKATPLHAKSGSNKSAYTFINGVTWAPPAGTYRRFSDLAMQQMDLGQEIWFGTDGSSTPSRKSFLSEVKDGITPITIWPYEEVGHTHEANNELKQLLGQGIFDNPKPTRLIRRILDLTTSRTGSDIVLDFFAGSGSTGHAVMAQNAADGGNRKFLLVQLPEKLDIENKDQKTAGDFCTELGKTPTIAELTRERLRRAADALKKAVPELTADCGFRAFRLDESNIRAWNPDSGKIAETLFENIDHIRSGRSESDILHELLLKMGLDLCVPIENRSFAGKTVSSIGAGALITCLEETISSQDVEPLTAGIATWISELAPAGEVTCVFRDSAFTDDIVKTNVSAILIQRGIKNLKSL